ncbi:hypothetical protein AB0I66_00810 [Streptomyces sp. NPDC050439]
MRGAPLGSGARLVRQVDGFVEAHDASRLSAWADADPASAA